jgi:tyrosinase
MATQISPGPSFENPHGAVHVAIGGQYGHMSQLSYSAFDPMFWLHHANVDRLFAMWQAIYPDVYLQPETEQVGTFTISVGTIDTSSSPLTPFYTPDGNTPWTSDSARDTRTFGYSYPSVPDAIITNATELAANVTATVNALYNPDGVFTSSKLKRDQQREWSVAVQALSTALDGRYIVKVLERGNPIGSLHVLQPPVADGGSKPVLTLHNEFSLQQVARDVDHSDIEAMVAYLKENLSWEVQKVRLTLLIFNPVSSKLLKAVLMFITERWDRSSE